MAGILLPADAQDTISSVAWSPTASHLAVASWDHRLRVYNVSQDGRSTNGLAMLAADGPLLSCDWAQDGTTVVAACADGASYLLHVATGTTARAGGPPAAAPSHHAKAVRAVRFVDAPGTTPPGAVYASGSWDGTVRYWDVRRPAAAGPLATLDCGGRVYALDARDGLLVVATAAATAADPGPPLHLVDLRRPAALLRTTTSPLRHQTRDVAVRPGGRGWATASIEGRVGISTVDETNSSASDNYTFRCHRTPPVADATAPHGVKTSRVYTVNTVRFHPVHATTAVTGGSDGVLNFWDIAARCRLRTYGREELWGNASDNDNNNDKKGKSSLTSTNTAAANGGAITTAAFRRDGALLAYAVGYDWGQGHAGNAPASPNKLMVLPVPDDAVKPRKR